MELSGVQVVAALVHTHEQSPVGIAAEMAVSEATVQRWLNGASQPRPATEGKLRQMLLNLSAHNQAPQDQRLNALVAVDRALRDLRDALHRRGRLSSRNEALDEASRLLFAHSMDLATGGYGITDSLPSRYGGKPLVQSLKDFVDDMVSKHLPETLACELSARDFKIGLKPQEEDLAREIVAAFAHLAAGEMVALRTGSGGLDIVNEAFGKFLSNSFIDEKELGQYLTPSEIVEFMTALALDALTPEETRMLLREDSWSEFGFVLDPSCGVASFLTEFVRQAHTKLAPAEEGWAAAAAGQLVMGVDKSERMIRLALSNLSFFGTTTVQLHNANALTRSGDESEVGSALVGRVGLILTNPPFGATFSGEDLNGYSIAKADAKQLKSVDSELLFMERYLDWLRPGGQLLAVVPDSILTNKGVFQRLRSLMDCEVQILNVVSLPPITFASAGTTTKTSILHLRKRSTGTAAEPTRFAVCSDVGYTVKMRGSQRTKVHNSESELPEIRRQLATGTGDLVRTADLTGATRWDAAHHAYRDGVAGDRSGKCVLISDVASLTVERIDPRRFGTSLFDYVEISNIDGDQLSVTSKRVPCSAAPSRARQRVQAGDVLVSTVRPERRTVGVVPDFLDGAICSTGIAVLRPCNVDSFVLARMLRSDYVTGQLMAMNVGIAYPTIDPGCLGEIRLDATLDSLKRAASAGAELNSAQGRLRLAREKLEHVISEFSPSA